MTTAQPPQPGQPQQWEPLPRQEYPQGDPSPAGYRPGGGLPPGYEIRKEKRFYKRVWFWLLIIFVIIVIVVIIAVVVTVADNAVSRTHDVVYKVTGTGKADIRYFESSGSGQYRSRDLSSQTLPWTRSSTIKGDLSGFIVTATPSGQNKAHLHCTLSVDGKIVSTDDSDGAIGVSCNGSGYSGGN